MIHTLFLTGSLATLLLSACTHEEPARLPSLRMQLASESLPAEGGTLRVTVTSSYTQWHLRAQAASEGQPFMEAIVPAAGGSAEREQVTIEVDIQYSANPDTVPNQQTLFLQALDGGQNRLRDTSVVLTQAAGTERVRPPQVNLAPSWKVEARNFLNGPAGAFDEVSVKDPSIVYYEGKYHLFFTGRDSTRWRTGYAAAPTLTALKDAEHHFLGSLQAGGYFCAPQVFWFKEKSRWYLIFQSGVGASFSTNPDLTDPDGWTPVQPMGFNDGIDFWCIADGNRVYCFYSAQDGSFTIKRRSTSVADFPHGWSEPEVVATQTFEAVHVYKNKADGHFYMIVEDIARHQELWEASDLGGTWTKLAENWAHKEDLVDLADHWTDQVSHVEVIRAGVDERLEVEDLNRCQLLIQGVVNGNYGSYGNIPYDLGVIRNY
ncbi:non-reducing end alpha-L-arabinofuranosidase family hydrolase [Catalinimonas alkaloidigena]|nr:non-reducing end alpha-L-arabinofuranosidase family hydrolase [Catalinimonas alkaloidigena]